MNKFKKFWSYTSNRLPICMFIFVPVYWCFYIQSQHSTVWGVIGMMLTVATYGAGTILFKVDEWKEFAAIKVIEPFQEYYRRVPFQPTTVAGKFSNVTFAPKLGKLFEMRLHKDFVKSLQVGQQVEMVCTKNPYGNISYSLTSEYEKYDIILDEDC